MPLKSHQVLGRSSLQPSDLLDLPAGNHELDDWMVYVDVLTQMMPGDISWEYSQEYNIRTKIKVVKDSADPKNAVKTDIYVGMTAAQGKKFASGAQHFREGNKDPSTIGPDKYISSHYKISMESNTAMNFWIAGIFENAYRVFCDKPQWSPTAVRTLEGL
ncbi:hypothetical protein PFICI_13648 [Pestalotiopsis fici W106-1]|uniref:Uncharacterized protein n=1 Tax=Pestalotiopsis fici (strain W106-1 / CGMCC3.15140) TaxID=1229662 RepID=W3WN04_PESFW|nr:uncharacterized protein PFICI_13648 [Pestalotiopsis fici W106-1]ETS75164.1 hypothetical protein PFICI_13648 [Pestalotiopsis fici W106-1]